MPTSDDQQIETDILESIRRQGFEVNDRGVAEIFIRHIGRYRLKAYWLPLTKLNREDFRGSFDGKFSFDDIIALYTFDRLLRLHVMDAIERIEVSVRVSLGRQLSGRYGDHGYAEKSIYYRNDIFQEHVSELKGAFRRASDSSFKKYGMDSKTDEETLPEIWKSVEYMTFGLLSKWISNLRSGHDRMSVADSYGMDEKFFCSVLRHLTLVRNVCAHHDRLWNQRFRIKMKLPIARETLRLSIHDVNDSRIYNTLVVISHLLKIIAPKNEWLQKLNTLIEQYPIVKLSEMGFPSDWRDRPIWTQNERALPPAKHGVSNGISQSENRSRRLGVK